MINSHYWLHFAAQGAVLKQVEDLLAFEKGDPAREDKVDAEPTGLYRFQQLQTLNLQLKAVVDATQYALSRPVLTMSLRLQALVVASWQTAGRRPGGERQT